jgi:hypothetical protein
MTRNHQESGNHKKATKSAPQGMVASATSAAEKIHRAVAALPLDVLERIERLERPVARVRRLQDQSITATYDMVRGINKEVALLMRADAAKQPKRRAKKQQRTSHPTPAPESLSEVPPQAPAAAVS